MAKKIKMMCVNPPNWLRVPARVDPDGTHHIEVSEHERIHFLRAGFVDVATFERQKREIERAEKKANKPSPSPKFNRDEVVPADVEPTKEQ